MTVSSKAENWTKDPPTIKFHCVETENTTSVICFKLKPHRVFTNVNVYKKIEEWFITIPIFAFASRANEQ